MKISRIIIIVVSVIVIIGVITGIYLGNKFINGSNGEPVEDCHIFTGGSFDIKFNTNGGNEIANMSICIACSPDSYEDLPVAVRDGFTFDGWYYDKELTNKVDITNTKDFTPIPKYNDKKCLMGYKDIELFAKWS